MRPGADSHVSRSRKSSASEAPTTFFLTRDPSISTSASITIPTKANNQGDESPVRTLKETLDEAGTGRQFLSRQSPPKLQRQTDAQHDSRRRSTIKPAISDILAHIQPPLTCAATPSEPLTPALASSRDVSQPGSPKSLSSRSLQRSDGEVSSVDETGSQAIMSDDEEDVAVAVATSVTDARHSTMEDSAPQLIMPSIKMPSRRPFTQRGKDLGHFKILVLGSKGSGRTSLIKSIVQLCEDVVHVDSLPISSRLSTPPDTTEIYASTRPYPMWWSEVDESRILRRRKSIGDAVLERNICFVDSAYANSADEVVSYVEQEFFKTIPSLSQPISVTAGLLSGRGGSQIDVVLYLFTNDTFEDDCAIVRRLSVLCNIIPLVSKSDLLSDEQIASVKLAISSPRICSHFTTLPANGDFAAPAPYSVSSANGPDFDNMDASLLMSPEYVQPLMPSELPILVERLFDPNSVSYLRHTTARKLVTWYASNPRQTVASPSVTSPRPATVSSPVATSPSASDALAPVTAHISLNTANSYALAKVADHTQREERLAHVRLSKWAADLQLSLQRERERYESLAQQERSHWLAQRMGEEIREGQVVPIRPSLSPASLSSVDKVENTTKDTSRERESMRYDVHDPLGLLRWKDTLRTRGWVALQIIGSFGVVGGIAVWLARTWGLAGVVHEWAQDWSEQWFARRE